MDRLQYKDFIWPENPERFQIQAVRAPKYSVNDLGEYTYSGLGPMCRVISGSGVFRGTYAYENFNTLQVILTNGVTGTLSHPIWGDITAYLTKLEMDSEGREGYVAYSFTFREADESGCIPALPENWE